MELQAIEDAKAEARAKAMANWEQDIAEKAERARLVAEILQVKKDNEIAE